MVFAAPELVVAETVEMLHEVEIAAELQHRMLAHRMMRSEKGAEIQTRHGGVSRGVMVAEQNERRSGRWADDAPLSVAWVAGFAKPELVSRLFEVTGMLQALCL